MAPLRVVLPAEPGTVVGLMAAAVVLATVVEVAVGFGVVVGRRVVVLTRNSER